MAVSRGVSRVGQPWEAGVLVAGEGVCRGRGQGQTQWASTLVGLVNGRD
jgi:hypothetical protein